MKFRPFRLLASLLLAATLACHDSPTQPATPSQSPTPVPVELDLNGKWSGTIEYDPSSDGSCPVSENVEITFTQSQNTLFALVPTHCFQTVELDGSLTIGQGRASLTLFLSLGNDIELATMTGAATNTQIDALAPAAIHKGYPISVHLTR